MKKFFQLALFLPILFASCSQDEQVTGQVGAPTTGAPEGVTINVEAIPAANIEGEQSTRVWSGSTLKWENPGGLGEDVTDRIALAYHAGNEVASFQSEPLGNVITLICDTPPTGSVDTGGYLPWRVFGSLQAGNYTAYYPFYANKNQTTTGAPVRFDLSEQAINTSYIAAYQLHGGSVYANDGLLNVEKEEPNPDDTQLSIRLNPVSSILHLLVTGCPNVTFTRIVIENVGTGFEYYPQEGEAFGFSTESWRKQKTAAELVSKGWGKEYKEGSITLTGELHPEGGQIEIYAWYLPVQEIKANMAVTLYDESGNAYPLENFPDLTTPDEGSHLARFNSGVFVRCSLGEEVVNPDEVEVTTGGVEVDNVTLTGAVIYGQIDGIGSGSGLQYGMRYRPSTQEDWIYVPYTGNPRNIIVELTGLTVNERYYYQTYLILDGEYLYGNIKSFRTQDWDHLNVDVVMCIDCTGSMGGVISTVKRNALSFYDSFVTACERKEIDLVSVTTQVIGFRDLLEGEPMEISSTYSLPSQQTGFNNFVRGLYANGGGDTPESGLEALDNAFSKLDWSGNDETYRRIIILWTDAPYLSTMSPSTLLTQWNSMPDGKRLILFAPTGNGYYNGGNWNAFDSWPNTIRYTNLYTAFTDFDYIIDVMSDEFGKTRKGTNPIGGDEPTEFRPN